MQSQALDSITCGFNALPSFVRKFRPSIIPAHIFLSSLHWHLYWPCHHTPNRIHFENSRMVSMQGELLHSSGHTGWSHGSREETKQYILHVIDSVHAAHQFFQRQDVFSPVLVNLHHTCHTALHDHIAVATTWLHHHQSLAIRAVPHP